MFHYEAELEEAMLTVVQHSPLPPYFTTIPLSSHLGFILQRAK